MNFKELKNKTKEEQKLLAKEIRRGKYLRKPKNRTDLSDIDISDYFWKNGRGDIFYDEGKVQSLSYTYRHMHIAYCMFFNKTPYEKIELKTRETKRPNKFYVDDMIKYFEKVVNEEVICDCS